MAKLTRYSQKTFGTSAPSAKMSQFGSFAAGSPSTYSGSTITPALVQNLSNFLTGWTGAIVGNNSGLIQDLNSLCYLFAYQLAYILQEGIPEWDSGTTYYTGSIVNYSGTLYQSTIDTNLNQTPGTSGSADWGPVSQLGVLTPNASAGNIEVSTGNSLVWANPTVSTGDTVTIDSGADFQALNNCIVNGTLIINGTMRIN